MVGILSVIGTPIGNRDDITLRALKTLFSVDILLCEDTRMTGKLLSLYSDELLAGLGIERQAPQLVRCDDFSERRVTPQVVEWLEADKNIGLVSDAGMPLISDPGFVLVRAVRDAGFEVTVVPGPSALTCAAAIAGVPVNQLLFLGFLPEKAGKRQKLLNAVCSRQYADELKPTLVLYESPYHLKRTLQEIDVVFEDPEVALVGEVTKLHEKVLRGKVSEVYEQLPEVIKGEWVVLVQS